MQQSAHELIDSMARAQAFGDDDPVDIVEIGSASIARGSVVQVIVCVCVCVCV